MHRKLVRFREFQIDLLLLVAKNVLKRNGLCQLPRNTSRHTIHYRRYAKEIPGHYAQVGVKFLSLEQNYEKKVRNFQHTIIYDAIRIRALKFYRQQGQKNAMDSIDPGKDTLRPLGSMSFRTDHLLLGHMHLLQQHHLARFLETRRYHLVEVYSRSNALCSIVPAIPDYRFPSG